MIRPRPSKMTLDVYAHSLEPQREQATEILEAVLSQ